MGDVIKVDANLAALRYCEEEALGVLDGTPANQRWIELEPNSFADFGGAPTSVARSPFNPSRQFKKGSLVNIEPRANFQNDLTQENMQDILQGFMFADLRNKQEFTGAAQTVATADDSYGSSGIHTGYFANDLVLASGYSQALNNGLKLVSSAAGDKVVVTTNLANETSPTTAKLVCVGAQLPNDVSITNSGSAFPTLNSPTKDLTQLGLIPGEIVFVGGDTTPTRFALNAPFYGRVRSVTASTLTFDKTSITLVTDDGTSTGSGGTTNKTIQIFKGRVLKNETGSLIVRRSYTLERTLGYSDDADATLEQAEYVKGAVPNEFVANINGADKLTCDLSFIGTEHDTLDENDSVDLLSKVSGVVRVAAAGDDAFNTSSDVSRVRMSVVSDTSALPDPLFTYAESVKLTVNNNCSPLNALGVFGAFEVATGKFQVTAEISCYFANVASIQAIRNNASVTLDIMLAKNNAGIAIDIPLFTITDGLLNLEQDQPVKLPAQTQAASGASVASTMDHTLMMVFYDYLPTVAE